MTAPETDSSPYDKQTNPAHAISIISADIGAFSLWTDFAGEDGRVQGYLVNEDFVSFIGFSNLPELRIKFLVWKRRQVSMKVNIIIVGIHINPVHLRL